MHDLLGPEIGELKYYYWTRAEVNGIPVVVTRTGWTSEVGYEIYLLDPTKGTELWQAVMEAGKPYKRPTDRAVRHPTHRGRHLQLGRRHDLREQPDRDGVGAAHLVEPARRRVNVDRRFEADPGGGSAAADRGRDLRWRPVPGAQLQQVAGVRRPAEASGGQSDVGIYSPRLKANIGYCWVPTEMAAEGTTLRVATEWGDRTATVVPMPFIDPEKRIPVS